MIYTLSYDVMSHISSCKQVWDIRTKAAVHSLTGHTNTIADVKCQGVEPQVKNI